ncbi:disease resistance protein At4g27190-like [Durio zibethinus]|uniref:Disease resistance protein At4g27190-like n=1 Tax=Durio zibethinus TaxID=66656 RepID=A0A6P5YYR5_DURZI|nr:disease resistance protein At4g27190-like [Durio zibethinus]XP_022745651.1 disease resistance protein At4g27190-like [Durio zibethinus]XP_022745652.1 disease resistance protein At4g27190-like [Durio zibethinus]XP_022745653.1 disease resistance protein At4g27190-like [Durio zibethinus]XP_022745654.1 disease resistance protein At4g27190-like [Durio zibethinus]XP_022745655.1 disease resistance protein At4g27190-like [Durio zibethinus]
MEACISIVGSILGSLAGKAVEYTVDPIARQVSYLFKHKSKFQNLRDQLKKLKIARESVQEDVNAATRQGKEIFSYVDEWLTKVRGICDEAAGQLDEDEEKAKQMCFVGLCPNFKSRYQLSRKAEKEANTIAELLKDKDRFGGVSYRPAPEGIASRPVREYEDFESRTGAFDAVMEALKDANLSIIGVYGMGGVGKTTLVKQVARQAKDDLFDKVVMAAVTQSFDIKKIQELIADELGLKFEMQSEPGRAGELRNRLKKSKVLVILDDIWEKLDMEALGVPYGGEHQGCKILLTSRKVDALSLMGSLKNIPIEILKEEEAWNLFKKKAGDIVLSPDLETTAIEVANECAGLPIAIVTVGEAMKNKKNLSDWKYALNELRNPSKRNFKGIPAGAYSAIELSYKFLEDEEHRPTFLLCSIMGHDAAIDRLLRYGMGLGLFHAVNTIKEARYKVSALVNNLKSSSLLLDGSTFERFDMHDVVCDVALSIASRDHHWLALGRDDDDVFKELSNEEKMRNCELISLQYAKVCEPSDHDRLECPNLTFVSLGSEDSSLKISDNFFRGMQKLRVLDFAKLDFPSLPSSFCFLKNLRTLCFSDCILKDIVIIEELKNLEILSFRKSKIAVLPPQIGQLIKLKLLDLSHCSSLKVISPNVLSRLSRLEELYLLHSFDRWEVEGHEKPRTNASLVELQHLCRLTTLEVHIPDLQGVPKELFSEKFERYKISIGEKWRQSYKSKTSRELKLKLNKSIYLDDSGVKTLLRKTETLHLDAGKDVIDMLYDPDTQGFPHLKHLDVCNDSEVKYLIKELASCKAFPLLETLFLRKLNNLEAIYYGQLQAECFGQLRKINVEDCNMLKNLFSFTLARKLGHLQKIRVSDCKNFTELIVEKREEEIGDDDILEFSQLRSLRLEDLPSFIGLFNSEKKLSSSQQGRVQSIDGSSTATALFDRKVVFPCLKELRLDSIIVEKLWHDQLSVTAFGVGNLTELTVEKCHNLKNLFTSSMVESFVQLKSLYIRNCNEIEEVITVTEGLLEEERMRKMVFPKLDNLHLFNLPNLKRFCCGNPIEFLSLKELWILGCPVLNTFHSDSTSVGTIVGNEAGKNSISMVKHCTDVPKYLFDEKVVFPGLKQLCLRSIPAKKLWHEQLSVTSFGVQNLTNLEVYACYYLKNIFTSAMVESFVQLKTLNIVECDELEEIIIVTEGLVEEEERMRKMVFPKLDRLKLSVLPKLKRFGFGNPIEFPSLTYLYIEGCPILNTVHFDSTSVGTTVGNEAENSSISMENLHSDISKYLFSEKLAFPNLQQLHLGWDDGMKERLHGLRLASDYFCKLKVLGLVGFPQQLAIFPSFLFQLLSLPNLESLRIEDCYFEELVFQSEGVGGEEGFQNLRILLVGECPKLKSNLVPSSVCFQNLMTLTVYGCDGIIKLVTHSTAKSLVQLREMRIRCCKKIEEIVEGSDGDRDEVKDEIIFPKLNLLELSVLSNLESFCSSGNHTFGFPSLATVLVHKCPKMKMFSKGGLNAPMLHKVRAYEWEDEGDWIWEGSLNSTIRKLFTERNPMEEMQYSIEDQGNPSISNAQST